ncbi:protein of unknown function (plasmid) [Azospirillum baldaniorum]|uniref:Uncharacterized protein n=1 Tax=Azospirillum baldaniorum TaxID=1064539 RepID=A0A9P1K004_9PROT|nr:protein of unknown function [Azospirillum baldaniorum]
MPRLVSAPPDRPGPRRLDVHPDRYRYNLIRLPKLLAAA